MSNYDWHDKPPINAGDYFYTGKLPYTNNEVVCIVCVYEKNGINACFFMPSNWRGQNNEPSFYSAPISDWIGQWSGPEYGLCHVVIDDWYEENKHEH